MTCKECIHYEACDWFGHIYVEEMADDCLRFKPKSRSFNSPCVVGDTIYIPWIYNDISGIGFCNVTHIIMSINKRYVKTNICSDDEGFLAELNGGEFEFDDFGKIVFLTEEEAEKALEERNKK